MIQPNDEILRAITNLEKSNPTSFQIFMNWINFSWTGHLIASSMTEKDPQYRWMQGRCQELRDLIQFISTAESQLELQKTELLQYFNGSVTFTGASKTMAATNIHVGLTVGDEFVITGTVSNNGTFTIATLGTNTMTVNEAVTNEGPVATTINQQVTGNWMRADFYSRLVGGYSLSNNATMYSEWSVNRSTILVSLTTAITGGTPAAYAQECIAPWVRFKVKNSGTDQTSVNVFIYAKGEV
jgi:hypothetical protein